VSFEKKIDADNWAAQVRSGTFVDASTNREHRRVTLREYGKRWRLSREIGWAVETRKRVESNLRCRPYPVFGDRPIRSITLTGVLEWLGR
jgi:hypothetical protein